MMLPIKYSKVGWKVRRQAREEYVRKQEGKCYYCGAFLHNKPTEHVESAEIKERLFPKNFFEHPVHLHHDHNTDLTIGAVHAKCNAYLWQYKGE